MDNNDRASDDPSTIVAGATMMTNGRGRRLLGVANGMAGSASISLMIKPPTHLPGIPYPSPPITEAVIEVKFEAEISEEERIRFGSKWAEVYPNESLHQLKRFHVDLDHERVATQVDRIVRRSNHDENEILLVGPHNLTVSQLAVYPGWDHFFGRFKCIWSDWKRHFGYRKIERLGVRYINRIDVPSDGSITRHEDYVNLYPNMPDEIPSIGPYALQVQMHLPELEAEATVNSATVESPMPECLAILIDIDIGKTLDVPQKDPKILSYLERVRHEKNRIFEASIKPAARERFFDENRFG